MPDRHSTSARHDTAPRLGSKCTTKGAPPGPNAIFPTPSMHDPGDRDSRSRRVSPVTRKRSRSGSRDGARGRVGRDRDRRTSIEDRERRRRSLSTARGEGRRSPVYSSETLRSRVGEREEEERKRGEEATRGSDRGRHSADHKRHSDQDGHRERRRSIPHPWQECLSSRGEIYFYNPETGESRWNIPNEPSHPRRRRSETGDSTLDQDHAKRRRVTADALSGSDRRAVADKEVLRAKLKLPTGPRGVSQQEEPRFARRGSTTWDEERPERSVESQEQRSRGRDLDGPSDRNRSAEHGTHPPLPGGGPCSGVRSPMSPFFLPAPPSPLSDRERIWRQVRATWPFLSPRTVGTELYARLREVVCQGELEFGIRWQRRYLMPMGVAMK
ncbi:uncharacterized protein VTP21DRAFT_340 [Calcarisporiella thermophila]|uniref:uncharacterized protein n=1 Tax=Calcarisporiella thermophila TaxID=911321 RepID=UPI003742C10E